MNKSSSILKTDIHCHLEACFRHQTLIEIGDRVGLPVPADVGTFKRDYLVANQKESLAEMIAGFDRVRALWFDPKAITRLTKEAVEDAAAQNVRLIELRYSPDFIQNDRDISFEAIHGAILDGISSANTDIAVGLIGIIRRTLPLTEAQKVADFITANADSFVGIDLADQELDYPGQEFAQLFRKAKASGLGITIHAGEISVEESRVNVRTAIEQMGAERIGHGLHIVNEPDLIQLVIDNDITLELCPTSNLLTGSIPTIEDHPFKKLMDAGVKTTINTDDPSLFAIDWNSEYAVAANSLSLSRADIDQCIENAKTASFIDTNTINKAWSAS
ncbi:MAG: adenosine deaminase [Gammaproteobacteria bacterium]|jgi:adenosine deaminase|nr:adenosine deaminase [Gammaproteobacteria bacterium]MBT5154276.1 adenosine deaminase [Gammaproteobacteria bacterium]MBT6585530.1 adenosine deaminase [Gammaproteobacteria bacterium]MBT6891913.1 adenosine deaminase [Gammaproteobacteria bacterium]